MLLLQIAYIIPIQIGPLPISDKSQILPLEFCYNSGRSHIRNLIPDEKEWQPWAKEVLMPSILDILMELVADNITGLDGVDLGAPYPSMENGRVVSWGSIVRLGSTAAMARTLLAQGLSFSIIKSSTLLTLAG